MKTVSKIVERLLGEGIITGEEAVILLKAEIEAQQQKAQQLWPPIQPYIPPAPYNTQPNYPLDEWKITCDDNTGGYEFQTAHGGGEFTIVNN